MSAPEPSENSLKIAWWQPPHCSEEVAVPSGNCIGVCADAGIDKTLWKLPVRANIAAIAATASAAAIARAANLLVMLSPSNRALREAPRALASASESAGFHAFHWGAPCDRRSTHEICIAPVWTRNFDFCQRAMSGTIIPDPPRSSSLIRSAIDLSSKAYRSRRALRATAERSRSRWNAGNRLCALLTRCTTQELNAT